MALEVDLKQILRNHHTSPTPFSNETFTNSRREKGLLQIGMESCLNVAWYCALNKTQAKIWTINKQPITKPKPMFQGVVPMLRQPLLVLIEVEFQMRTSGLLPFPIVRATDGCAL